MTSNDNGEFFIGWKPKLPKGLGRFVMGLAVLIIVASGGAAYTISATQPSPGGEGVYFGFKRQNITGIFQAKPYPVIRLLPSEQFPEGHTVLLSGPGKRGVQKFADHLDGQAVSARGIIIKRGTIDMMQVSETGVKILDANSDELAKLSGLNLAPKDFGRWSLTGEICDGKCYAGAMRPGRGLAHKACGNLCLLGGIPPVFVSTDKVAASFFFMIGDENGNPLTDKILDLTAVLIEAEGRIEQRGDLMVFKMDLDSVRVR